MSHKAFPTPQTDAEGVRAYAESYRERGWVPIPVASGDKKPTRDKWQNSTLRSALDDFSDGCNVGIVLGEPSGGLVDIDLDCPEAVAAARYLLPETGLKFGRTSKPNSHWLYTVENCGDTQRFQFAGNVLLEYRANGGQTVFPPSVHESGEVVEFSATELPANISRAGLLRVAGKLAACSLLGRNWKGGNRHDATLALSGALLRNGWKPEEVREFIRALCVAGHDEEISDRLETVETTERRLQFGGEATGLPALALLVGKNVVEQISRWLGLAQSAQADLTDEIRFTESGNADRFVIQHRDEAAYCAELKSWLIWNDGRWKEDKGKRIVTFGDSTARSILGEAVAIQDSHERDKTIKWAKQSLSKYGIDHMIGLSESRLHVPVEQLDQNPWLLNCTNGVVDLRSGKLLPHDRGFWITKQVPVDYDPDAKCPRFDRFLNEITNGDSSLIEFLARALGYSLTGSAQEQCFFIAYGEGANGKSTLLGLFRHIMADYAENVPVETLIVKKREGGASPEIMKLRGARYVTAGEAEANQKMAESLVKQLTGGDTITARGLFRDPIDFMPEFKLWLATNHKPRVSGTDPAMWRRIHLSPFTVTIPPEKRDGTLPEKLKAEAAGILAWAVRGCLDWQAQGLNPPTVVTDATKAYKAEMDEVGQFLSDCVQHPAKGTVTKPEMFQAYERWATGNGVEQVPIGMLGNRLKAHGIEERKSGSQRLWKNVQLVQPEFETDDMAQEFPTQAGQESFSEAELRI